MRRLGLSLALAAVFLLPQALKASQQNQVLPTTGIVTSVEFSGLITGAIAALNSCNSGITAPTNATGGTAIAGQCWLDTSTTPWVKKVYNGSAWLVVAAIDPTGNLWMPPIGGGVAPVASAATTDICSVRHSYVDITGSVTITSFGGTACVVGQVKVLKFAAALTLTHSDLTLALPGSSNIAVAAGDTAIAVKVSATKWEVINYTIVAAPAVPSVSSQVPIGTMLDYVGFTPPTDYAFCDGTTISRATYTGYVTAMTSVRTATTTNASAVLTAVVGGTEQLRIGMSIEGTGIPAGATILSTTVDSVTMSVAATATGTVGVTFFATGNGNGTTTISLPDKRGRAVAGRDDMSNSAANRLTSGSVAVCDGKGLGASCGAQSGTLTESQLPIVTKTVTMTVNVAGTVSGTVSGTTETASDHTHPFTDDGTADVSVASGTGALVSVVDPVGGAADVTGSGGAHTHPFSAPFSAPYSASDNPSTDVTFGSSSAHSRLQPTLVTNCIVRIR